MGNNTLRIRDISVPQLPDEDCWAVKMRKAMRDALTVEDFAGLARSLMDKAKAGDKAALQVVLGQVLGSSPKSVTINQHFQQRRRRKKTSASGRKQEKATGGNGGGGGVQLPRPAPGIDEIESRVGEMRAAKGLPPAKWSRG